MYRPDRPKRRLLLQAAAPALSARTDFVQAGGVSVLQRVVQSSAARGWVLPPFEDVVVRKAKELWWFVDESKLSFSKCSIC